MHDRATTRVRREAGFTLVEILLAITLVGVLSAVAIVGIGALTDNASAATCTASSDAARTATNTYFVRAARYPASFTELTQATAGHDPAMRAPSGASVTAQALSTSQWTLTMSSTVPPVFTCTSGPPPTSTTPTTFAPGTGNGVTATVHADYGQIYYGESVITLHNSAPITAMTVTIQVAQTTGVTYHGQYDNFVAGTVDDTNSTANGFVTFTFTLAAGQSIPAGSWTLDAQTDGTTTLHPTTGDTWSVVTTSGGVTSTLSGGF